MRTILIAAVLALALPGSSARAEGPPPFRDFTFKRVKPPAAGAVKRILVQIDPAEVLPGSKPAVTLDPGTPASTVDATPDVPSGGFWDDVPASGFGSGGLDLAMAALNASTGQGAGFRLDALRRIADRHGDDILAATVGTRVSPALALAVIAVESGGRAQAVSHAGAVGLMQLMPATASRFGVSDSRMASDNIRGGVRYLDWLMGRFGQDPILVLAGYNAGEGAVDRHGGVPPYAETRDYVPKVLQAFQIARGLCRTPPLLISDGCVFVGERIASTGSNAG
ncbi:transglycosylase-like protein with SLT domain [Palleronia aestuarii]|uniref:Transglycosylase-like protein with SLT domain n=1 Tax=Palleronia aestuarii TaxID=568105 RepID=A0A2W7NGZ8_9RHOB|nr:lytic transglycosylase domain-containing protein [Palleronia aestuarii]PZX19685.1 transglycosylase-like protein with SLT domain [Palleronia aestuarii]